MIKENKLTSNINEYGIEILFDSSTEINNNNKILKGGFDNDKLLNYDDLIFINKIHKIIFNLFKF